MKYILSIILALSSVVAKGQTTFTSQYNPTVIGMAAGLPGNYVDDMLTDSNGFVWIAIYGSGLVRYDGYTCMSLPTSNIADRLGSYSCKTICEDKHKRIWVAFDEGVRVIDMNTLQPITPTYKGKPISDILDEPAVRAAADANGDVWIVTRTHIYYLRIDTSGNVSDIAKTSYSGNTPSICIVDVDNDGAMWAALGGKIMKLSPRGNAIVMDEVAEVLRDAAARFVTDIRIFADDLWIATNDGLYRYPQWMGNDYREGRTPSAFRPRRYTTPSISHNFTTCLAPYGRETLLIGSLGGVQIYNARKDTFELWNTKSSNLSMPSDFVNCLMVQESQIWIGTETGGIVKMNAKILNVNNITASSGEGSISGNPVNSIYVESDGTLWVGTVDGGLNRRKQGQLAFVHYTTSNSRLTHNTVSTLSPDNKSTLWVGTWGGGVCWINTSDPEAVVPLAVDAEHQRLIACIGALAFDPINNGLWIGSNEGVYFYDYATKRMYDPFEGCRNIRGCIGSIVEKSGRLWIGCLEGAVEIDLKTHDKGFKNFKFIHYRYKLDNPDSRIVEKISCFCIDSEGSLWLGSNEYGLYKRTVDGKGKTAFKAFTQQDGLANNSVKGIVEDQKHRLWITTINGLSCLNPKSGVFTNYGTSDGLLSNQFYWNSAVKSADGTIYLGADKGLSELYGVNNGVAYQGNLRFTRAAIDNLPIFAGSEYLDKDISIAEKLRMHESDKSLEIEFSTLNYRNEGGETYSYRMKGFEDEWRKLPAGAHSVRYTNLPSGDYTFEVRHDTDLSDSDANIAAIEISVSPYFWKSPIFVALAVVALLALCFYFYKKKVEAVRKSEAESLMKSIEDALQNYETPAKIRRRIESILSNQRRYDESSTTSAEESNEDTKEPPFMDKLIAVVAKNYKDSEFGVTELSNELGMTRNAISKHIARETGQSTSQFLKSYRLSIAHRLLTSETNKRNVTEIAFAVGFNDPKYFTRCFVAEYGVSPSSLLNDGQSSN